MSAPSAKLKVLLTGASGYVGPFVVRKLAPDYDVLATFNTKPVTFDSCKTVQLNLPTPSDESVRAITEFDPDVVIHAAAMANTAVAEEKKNEADAANVAGTEKLLSIIPNKNALFIYISTDLVFDGEEPPYDENKPVKPICHYGVSKLGGEESVQREWKEYVILRSGLEYGPPAPGSGRTTFLQFFDATLSKGSPLSCFDDEFRTILYVEDMAAVIKALVDTRAEGAAPAHQLYHVGGPERLSRFDIARHLAAHRGYHLDHVTPIPTKTATSLPRPPDTAYDISRLRADFPHHTPTPLAAALVQIFPRS